MQACLVMYERVSANDQTSNRADYASYVTTDFIHSLYCVQYDRVISLDGISNQQSCDLDLEQVGKKHTHVRCFGVKYCKKHTSSTAQTTVYVFKRENRASQTRRLLSVAGTGTDRP